LPACANGDNQAGSRNGLKNLSSIREHPSIPPKKKLVMSKSEKKALGAGFEQGWFLCVFPAL
jgi:hypothetical protein